MTDRVKDKVVVVTGAGRGIGREIALAMAAEGAKVVVNDLGTASDGSGSDTSPAEQVAAEIVSAGGEAVANLESVAEPDSAKRIIEHAVDAFGRIDCVVNNAGIVRDKIFHKMDAADFDIVIKVHLAGAFYVSNAAAQFFRAQNSGSFVHMTSSTGIIGNVGQVNYGAAKAGILGLSKCIALDMARYNVRSNCISPSGWTRLVDTIEAKTPEQEAFVDRVRRRMSPAKNAPLAVFLCSDDSAKVSGQIFAVRGNEIFFVSQSRPVRSVHQSDGWDAGSVAEHMLPAFKNSFYPLEVINDVYCWDPL